MNFTVDVLFQGFSGSLPNGVLGLGTWALIRTEDKKRNILFDAGGPVQRGYVEKLLGEYELKPSDITDVILSHCHFDHVNNIDFFPHAMFYMTREEWDYMNDLTRRDRYVDEKAILLLRSYRLTLLNDENKEIFPKMTYMLTPGHTPGSMSVVLDQGDAGKWVLAGDAAKNRGELRTLECMMSLNPEQSAASLRKIKSTASRVLPGHDGWLTIKNGEIIPEGGNDLHIQFGQSVTINGGKTYIDLHMD